jgi:hypothetical protein
VSDRQDTQPLTGHTAKLQEGGKFFGGEQESDHCDDLLPTAENEKVTHFEDACLCM